MSDIGSSYPVAVQSKETKETKLKWIQTAKQEKISRIAHFKQSIEDLLKGKVPEIERQIILAEQELAQLEAHENLIKSSVEAEQI